MWLTKDEKLAVIHGTDDGRIHETTNGHGNVMDMTFAELQKFDAGKGERIPLLEDILTLCKDQVFVNIEIKPQRSFDVVFKVVELLEARDAFGGCCVSSFDHKLLAVVEDLTRGKLEIGYLYDEAKAVPLPSLSYIVSHGNTANLCFTDITPALVEALHSHGMGALAWVTSAIPREQDWYNSLILAGTDILCVNRPDLLLRRLGRLQPRLSL